MLDEIREFKEYKNSKTIGRLKSQTTKNGFSGLKRPLEILSVKYLSDAYNEQVADKISYTKEKLKEWIEDYYIPHIKKVYGNTAATGDGIDAKVNKKNAKSAAEVFEKRKQDLDDPVIYPPDMENRKNDTRSNSNQLSYERVIANAINTSGYGGLKRYYLVCDDNLLNEEHIHTRKNSTSRTNAGDTVVDVVSKMTAAYLLKKKQVPDSDEQRLSQVDIFNWIVKGNYPQYFEKTTYYMETEEKSIRILKKIPVGNKSQNTVKYSFSEEWIKHFAVIEENELDAWLEKNKDKQNKHFYSDWGFGKSLKKDKRYRRKVTIK